MNHSKLQYDAQYAMNVLILLFTQKKVTFYFIAFSSFFVKSADWYGWLSLFISRFESIHLAGFRVLNVIFIPGTCCTNTVSTQVWSTRIFTCVGVIIHFTKWKWALIDWVEGVIRKWSSMLYFHFYWRCPNIFPLLLDVNSF